MTEDGARLELPLLRLATGPVPVARLLDLDASVDVGFDAWKTRIAEAAEACFLLDKDGRVAAMSTEGARTLGLDVEHSVGALLLDLLELVDFSVVGVPFDEPELQAPPLQALVGGRLSRGLIRVRDGHALTTYDVVGVPLDGRHGALAFVSPV